MRLRLESKVFVTFCTLLVFACAGDEHVSLTVKLRTDFQPLREFMSVEVLVDSEPQDLIVKVDGQYVRPGETLALFEGLSPNERRSVTVTLRRLGGNALISSTVLVEHTKDLILTVAITRDCSGKVCQPVDGNAQRCLAGVCVDARCATGDEPYCNEAFVPCLDDSSCTAAAPCAKATCEAGLCFSDAQNSLCAMNEVCDIESLACVPASVPGECMVDGDCTRGAGSSGCVLAQCLTDVEACLYTFAANGTACGTGLMCQNGACVSGVDPCTNGIRDGDESDIDCGGGVCGGCGIGGGCAGGGDCLSGVCDTLESNTCEAANTCGNGLLETGEGCDDGGTVAGDGCDANCKKEDGAMCAAGTECASDYCSQTNLCSPSPPGHCSDTVLSGDETAVDCGGSCPGCAGGQACIDGADCSSYVCTVNICENQHCGDGVLSGDELGVDCGGSCGTNCVSYDCAAQTQIPLAECEYLKNYYNATDGPGWTSITNWFSDAMPCGWTGITCSSVPGNISQLLVLENNQHGVIARGIDTLTALTRIEIDASSCCSTFTDIFGLIPAELGNLTGLTQLELDHSGLMGSIPPTLGQLSNLTSLRLRLNRLSGPIPPELSQLSNLVTLRLNNNQLSGTIPPELGQLTRLTTLNIYLNNLTGNIPPELDHLINLRTFYIYGNQLTGFLPITMANLSKLNIINFCPQTGMLESDAATGVWLRSLQTTNWPVGDSC